MERATEWPNPDAVVYPTTQPPGFPCQITTRDAGKSTPIHQHGAWLNAEGDGNTDLDSGHFHRVRGFRVMPDESDGHTHNLTMLPCGVGAARRIGHEGQLISQPVMMGDVQLMDSPKSTKVWWILGGLAVVGLVIGGICLYRANQED